MRKLTDSLVRRSPLTTVLLVGLLSLVTGVPLSPLFGDLPMPALWSILIAAIFWLALLWAITKALFPIVRVDETGKRIRVHGQEYPTTAVLSATRSISENATAAYLTYRFTLEGGRRFRVIAAGRPFRGLTPEGLRGLRSIVEASAIAEPAGLTPEQQRLSSTLQSNRRAAPVGPMAILQDLDELLGESEPEAHIAPKPQVSVEDINAIAEQDRAAHEVLEHELSGVKRLRRMSGSIALLGALALGVLLILLVVDENFSIPGWSQDHPSSIIVATSGFFALTVGSAVWSITADAWVRGARHRADRWWARADAAARELGLPTPYLLAEMSGARRWVTGIAFTSLVLAIMAFIISIAAFFVDDTMIALPFAVAAFLAAVAFAVLSIFCWRRSRRDVRTTAERVALRSGSRQGIGPGA